MALSQLPVSRQLPKVSWEKCEAVVSGQDFRFLTNKSIELVHSRTRIGVECPKGLASSFRTGVPACLELGDRYGARKDEGESTIQ